MSTQPGPVPSFLQCPKKGLHDSSLEKTMICATHANSENNINPCVFWCYFSKLWNIFKKTLLNKSTLAKAKSLWYLYNIQFLVASMYPSLKKHWKNEGKMMSKRHPLNHQKVKKTIGFIVFLRKWRKRKLMKIYAKTMKTQNVKNLIKPVVFLFFRLKKQGSRDGPGTPGPWLPETDFHSKTYTKVDFLIKPNIKKTSKTINGH